MQSSAKTDSSLAKLSLVITPLRPLAPPFVERRALARRHALRGRICEEFLEMPGTALTLPQAARLFGLSGDICTRILSELVRDNWLTLAADSRYRRHSAA